MQSMRAYKPGRFARRPVLLLHFLVVLTGDPARPVSDALLSVTLREGEDFLEDLIEELGDFYILETEETR